MSGEQGNKSLLHIAIETGKLPVQMGQVVGGYAYQFAVNVLTGRPPAEEPHITERIEASLPLNEALIGRQYVEIGQMIDPDSTDDPEEHRRLEAMQDGYLTQGHRVIAQAAISAGINPSVDNEIQQQVLDIAHEVGTQPAKLADALPEHTRKLAERIIDPQ